MRWQLCCAAAAEGARPRAGRDDACVAEAAAAGMAWHVRQQAARAGTHAGLHAGGDGGEGEEGGMGQLGMGLWGVMRMEALTAGCTMPAVHCLRLARVSSLSFLEVKNLPCSAYVSRIGRLQFNRCSCQRTEVSNSLKQ